MKKTVLVVENDHEIKQIVSHILELEGYEVKGARYDRAELTQLQGDLILLDEWINQREGHMLCKEIKAIKDLQHIPVIIFSTAADIAEIAQTCNADGFVKKPFDIDTLISVVMKFLPLTRTPQTA